MTIVRNQYILCDQNVAPFTVLLQGCMSAFGYSKFLLLLFMFIIFLLFLYLYDYGIYNLNVSPSPCPSTTTKQSYIDNNENFILHKFETNCHRNYRSYCHNDENPFLRNHKIEINSYNILQFFVVGFGVLTFVWLFWLHLCNHICYVTFDTNLNLYSKKKYSFKVISIRLDVCITHYFRVAPM